MVTALPRPLLAAWHTFVVNEHARSTTPGMPVLYERLTSQHPGAPVIYLSTGAWNVAPTLTRFLSRNLYPAGATAAHRLGADRGSVVPQRAGAQARRIWSGWRGVPGHQVAADRRRRAARRGDLRRLPEQAPGPRRPPSASGSSPPARPSWPAAATQRDHASARGSTGALAVGVRRCRPGRRTGADRPAGIRHRSSRKCWPEPGGQPSHGPPVPPFTSGRWGDVSIRSRHERLTGGDSGLI